MKFIWGYNSPNMVKMSSKDVRGLQLVKDGGCGETSKVYHLNDDKCLKVFNHSLGRSDLKRMDNFCGIYTDCANLPTQLVIINSLFKAYISDYIQGVNLSGFDDMIEYSEFLRIADQLIKSSLQLSEEGIRIFDLHSDNIMYDYVNNRLVLIDVNEWSRVLGAINYTKIWNFRIINSTISRYMFGIGNMGSLYIDSDFITINDDYIDYYESFREQLEKDNNIKIKTLNDIKKIRNDINGNKKL